MDKIIISLFLLTPIVSSLILILLVIYFLKSKVGEKLVYCFFKNKLKSLSGDNVRIEEDKIKGAGIILNKFYIKILWIFLFLTILCFLPFIAFYIIILIFK